MLLTIDGFQSLDVRGPSEVLNSANVRKEKASTGHRTIIASRAGDDDDDDALALGMDQVVAEWMRTIIKQARRFGSICAHTFARDAMGLLNGRRVTTHWE